MIKEAQSAYFLDHGVVEGASGWAPRDTALMDIPSMIMGAAIASVAWIAFWPRKGSGQDSSGKP